MNTGSLLVVAGTFLACAVEMVEALTIVLGVGVVRGWRSTLIGAGAAGIVLVALVAALGPTLGSIPIGTLRLVVGALLLAFGLQWLRKAILRSSGFKELHDEDAAYRSEQAQAAAAGDDHRRDRTARAADVPRPSRLVGGCRDLPGARRGRRVPGGARRADGAALHRRESH